MPTKAKVFCHSSKTLLAARLVGSTFLNLHSSIACSRHRSLFRISVCLELQSSCRFSGIGVPEKAAFLSLFHSLKYFRAHFVKYSVLLGCLITELLDVVVTKLVEALPLSFRGRGWLAKSLASESSSDHLNSNTSRNGSLERLAIAMSFALYHCNVHLILYLCSCQEVSNLHSYSLHLGYWNWRPSSALSCKAFQSHLYPQCRGYENAFFLPVLPLFFFLQVFVSLFLMLCLY